MSDDKPEPLVCFHCLEAVPPYTTLSVTIDAHERPMCCVGCKSAAEFILARGLERFYQHRGDLSANKFFAEVAVPNKSDTRSDSATQWQFIDTPNGQKTYVHSEPNGTRSVRVEVSGIYCASCSWLIDRAIREIAHDLRVRVDTDAKCIYLETSDSDFLFADVLATIAGLGYAPKLCAISESPMASIRNRDERLLAIKRILVAGFGTMQVMTYAVASYVDAASMQTQYARFLALVSLLVATVVVFYSGSPFFRNAYNDLRHKRLGMDVPVALAIGGAYFPSVYTVLTGGSTHIYFDSAVMFVFFLSLGRFLEMRARHRLTGANDDVESLLPRVITVQRFHDNQVTSLEVEPQQIQVGDQMQLRAGDIAAFDASITGGSGEFDESLITGESRPVLHAAGDRVVAGSRVLSGTLMLEAVHGWTDSSIFKIQRLLQKADRPERLAHSYLESAGRYFVAVVLCLTALVGLIWSFYQPDRVFEVCLAMLVASCPCAFSLAAPVARSTAINTLKRVGVLISNNRALESIATVSHWCFDKTGTISAGKMRIQQIVSVGEQAEIQGLKIASSLESQSDHLLASAFQTVDQLFAVSGFSEETGQGVTGRIDGVRYYLGKRGWVCERTGIAITELDSAMGFPANHQQDSEVVLASSAQLIAIYLVRDEIRPSAANLVNHLISNGQQVTLISGDRESAVRSCAESLQINDYRANQLPEDKLDYISSQQQAGQTLAMVGDGVNDAPVLAAADFSVALASGSELSANNADVILLNGNLGRLIDIQTVATRTQQVTRQNLVWALGYNVLVLPLAALGFLTPWIAALGMSLSSLLVVLNASRIRRALAKRSR
ncbi:Cu2+-exporting ATPase [Arenicella xantha]|uniref:Cu2+-exporting ATPase n=2 Tax=Arenicella xantha TaxID=644221 RepID=A0A395JJV3_9GAMM|nr:Cu2+-exporting ATPase [Arenicella xantha]